MIDKALNELGALTHFKGKKVTLTGDFTADGDIDDIHMRGLGNGASVNVAGDVGRVKAKILANNANVEVAGILQKFVAQLLENGSGISADQVDMLKVKQHARGATIEVGEGGLCQS